MRSTLLAGAVLAAVASAQTQTSGAAAASTVSQSMPPTATQGFQIGLVDDTTKLAWCTSQRNLCPKICGGTASLNTCDRNTLAYECVCQNGTAPDVSVFQGTIPFFVCQENFKQCTDAHPDDLDGQTTCKENQKCGERNATSETGSSTSSSTETSATTTSGSSSSETASSTASASSSSSRDNAAVTLNSQLTTGAFAGLLLVAFKLLL